MSISSDLKLFGDIERIDPPHEVSCPKGSDGLDSEWVQINYQFVNLDSIWSGTLSSVDYGLVGERLDPFAAHVLASYGAKL